MTQSNTLTIERTDKACAELYRLCQAAAWLKARDLGQKPRLDARGKIDPFRTLTSAEIKKIETDFSKRPV